MTAQPLRPEKRVLVITCNAPSGCTHKQWVGQHGIVVRVEETHALVQFSGGAMAWLPQFHLEEVQP